MVNNYNLKVIITYKTKLREKVKKGKTMYSLEFGVAYNDAGPDKKIHKGIAYCEGRIAEFISKRMRVKDIILIHGYLSSRKINCIDVMMFIVKGIEPLKTKGATEYVDVNVSNTVFDEYLRGFDVDEKEVR